MNGILIINKDSGYTSRDVVNIVSKKLNTKKVGHTGTLDPMAKGVLVLCVGKALKICELLTNHDKEYIAGVTLGIETDTLDTTGNIISTKNVDIDKNKIIKIVNSFKKSYLQEVPKYSAVKVNGKKLYEYARNNISVDLPKKMVDIKDIQIIDNIKYEDGVVFFKIKCTVSKGTYIRSLIRDIGKCLNVPAVMNSLIRTRLGNFSLDDSYTLEEFNNNKYKFIKIEDVFKDIKRIIVSNDIAIKIRNGVDIPKFTDTDMKFIFDNDNNLIALYKNDGNFARVYKMFI